MLSFKIYCRLLHQASNFRVFGKGGNVIPDPFPQICNLKQLMEIQNPDFSSQLLDTNANEVKGVKIMGFPVS